jgi:acyl-CoA thioesterase I
MKIVPLNALITATLLLIGNLLHAQIKVACVGNSITAGSRLNGAKTYPQQLQLLLGTGYEVRNFGHSGATAQRHTPIPYWKQTVYSSAKEWQPDIVIIKLGTNDSKLDGDRYWRDEKTFYKDYADLVDTFRLLQSNPKIYVCYPIPVFKDGQYTISESVVTGNIIPTIKKIARQKELTLIDLYSPFVGRMDLIYKEHDKDDLIHPNGEGAKFLAEEVYKLLQK